MAEKPKHRRALSGAETVKKWFEKASSIGNLASLFGSKSHTVSEVSDLGFDPEDVTEQKREWMDMQLNNNSSQLTQWPGNIFDHFVVVGLPPNVDVEAVSLQMSAQDKKRESEMHVPIFDKDISIPMRDSKDPSYNRPPMLAYEAEVLYTFPPELPCILTDKDLTSLCFPHGVAPTKLKRTPSFSSLHHVIHGRQQNTADTCFVFVLKVGLSHPWYGACCYVPEMIHKTPSLSKSKYPDCNAPFCGSNIMAPRCYCMLSRYPFFDLHFQVINVVLNMERLERLVAFNRELCDASAAGSPSSQDTSPSTQSSLWSPSSAPQRVICFNCELATQSSPIQRASSMPETPKASSEASSSPSRMQRRHTVDYSPLAGGKHSPSSRRSGSLLSQGTVRLVQRKCAVCGCTMDDDHTPLSTTSSTGQSRRMSSMLAYIRAFGNSHGIAEQVPARNSIEEAAKSPPAYTCISPNIPFVEYCAQSPEPYNHRRSSTQDMSHCTEEDCATNNRESYSNLQPEITDMDGTRVSRIVSPSHGSAMQAPETSLDRSHSSSSPSSPADVSRHWAPLLPPAGSSDNLASAGNLSGFEDFQPRKLSIRTKLVAVPDSPSRVSSSVQPPQASTIQEVDSPIENQPSTAVITSQQDHNKEHASTPLSQSSNPMMTARSSVVAGSNEGSLMSPGSTQSTPLRRPSPNHFRASSLKTFTPKSAFSSPSPLRRGASIDHNSLGTTRNFTCTLDGEAANSPLSKQGSVMQQLLEMWQSPEITAGLSHRHTRESNESNEVVDGRSPSSAQRTKPFVRFIERTMSRGSSFFDSISIKGSPFSIPRSPESSVDGVLSRSSSNMSFRTPNQSPLSGSRLRALSTCRAASITSPSTPNQLEPPPSNFASYGIPSPFSLPQSSPLADADNLAVAHTGIETYESAQSEAPDDRSPGQPNHPADAENAMQLPVSCLTDLDASPQTQSPSMQSLKDGSPQSRPRSRFFSSFQMHQFNRQGLNARARRQTKEKLHRPGFNPEPTASKVARTYMSTRSVSVLMQTTSDMILERYYLSSVVAPGERYVCEFGNMAVVEYERPLLNMPFKTAAPIQELLSYAECELSENLRLWSIAALCRSLSLDNIITLINAVLLERQVVMFCPSLGTLCSAVLSVIPMMRPFSWQCLLLPITPNSMLEFLEAPVPFILGVQYKTPDVQSRSAHLIRVNIYKDSIKRPPASGSLPPLPNMRALRSNLSPHYSVLHNMSSLNGKRPMHSLDADEQLAANSFLNTMFDYMSNLCGDLRPHTIVNVGMSKRTGYLMKEAFIMSHALHHREFMRIFTETQMFSVYSDAVIAALSES